MLTGKKLGAALREAMRLKRVGPTEVAREFGIKPPSVYDWMDHGRIGKKHIDGVIEFFSDVVPRRHWGIDFVDAEARAWIGSIIAVLAAQRPAEGALVAKAAHKADPKGLMQSDFGAALLKVLAAGVERKSRGTPESS